MLRNGFRSIFFAFAVVALTSPMVASQASADLDAAAAKHFFNDRGCNACHGLDEQRIGPAYQVVAARYAAEYATDPSDRIEKLAMKIRFGGAGAWGVVPMISNPGVSDEDARAVARWILSLQKTSAQSPRD